MRFSELVRVENTPVISKKDFDKGLHIKARVSFKTQRPVRTYDNRDGKKEWTKSYYSSLFVSFTAFKKDDGTLPYWEKYIVPGQLLCIEGQIYSTRNDKGNIYTNIDVDRVSLPIQNKGDDTLSGTEADTNATPATTPQTSTVSASSTEVVEEDIPF